MKSFLLKGMIFSPYVYYGDSLLENNGYYDEGGLWNNKKRKYK